MCSSILPLHNSYAESTTLFQRKPLEETEDSHSTLEKMAYTKLDGAQVPTAAILAAAQNAPLAMQDDGGHWSTAATDEKPATIRFVLTGVTAGWVQFGRKCQLCWSSLIHKLRGQRWHFDIISTGGSVSAQFGDFTINYRVTILLVQNLPLTLLWKLRFSIRTLNLNATSNQCQREVWNNVMCHPVYVPHTKTELSFWCQWEVWNNLNVHPVI